MEDFANEQNSGFMEGPNYIYVSISSSIVLKLFPLVLPVETIYKSLQVKLLLGFCIFFYLQGFFPTRSTIVVSKVTNPLQQILVFYANNYNLCLMSIAHLVNKVVYGNTRLMLYILFSHTPMENMSVSRSNQ